MTTVLHIVLISILCTTIQRIILVNTDVFFLHWHSSVLYACGSVIFIELSVILFINFYIK